MGWAQVYRVRPRVPLACPGCGWAVHAKHSPQGVRFFCHDPGRDSTCELGSESWEHHMLKLELASAVRSAGWHAALEVAGGDGAWRADVMASSPDGSRRIAWEAQLSPITDGDILARTARYAAEGIGVCWASPGLQAPPVDRRGPCRTGQRPRPARGVLEDGRRTGRIRRHRRDVGVQAARAGWVREMGAVRQRHPGRQPSALHVRTTRLRPRPLRAASPVVDLRPVRARAERARPQTTGAGRAGRAGR
ncbi:competence protein CoiA family protein [Streptomyces rameus]|uniref:competence protein CoiA family protein n=1 Tax=Streptomyces rameus TaxID=68261 RepID=UPI003CD06CC0